MVQFLKSKVSYVLSLIEKTNSCLPSWILSKNMLVIIRLWLLLLMFPWETGITIMMLPTTKMKGFIWVKAKSLYSAWFNLRFMQAP